MAPMEGMGATVGRAACSTEARRIGQAVLSVDGVMGMGYTPCSERWGSSDVHGGREGGGVCGRCWLRAHQIRAPQTRPERQLSRSWENSAVQTVTDVDASCDRATR